MSSSAPARGNIHRTPHWRWRRAIKLVDAELRPTRVDDEPVVRAWRFLRRKKSVNAATIAVLEEDYPDIFYANSVYEHENHYRWILEACLCTAEPFERIASDHGYALREIKAYDALFFDVRTRLYSPAFVKTHILEPALQNRTTDVCSPDFAPKLVALMLGYDALSEIIRGGAPTAILQQFSRATREGQLTWKGVETAYTMPVNKFTAIEIMKVCQEMDRSADERGRGTKDTVVDAIAELLQSVRFKKRTASDSILSSDGAEPRALENADIAFEAEQNREDEDS